MPAHETDLTEFRNVAFFGDHPVDAASKNDYFDSFAHATAVVGLNTSAARGDNSPEAIGRIFLIGCSRSCSRSATSFIR